MAIEPRLHHRFLFAAKISRVVRQMFTNVRHDDFAICGGKQTHADCGDQHWPQDAYSRYARGQKSRHFLMALDPGDREHHRDER